MLLGGIGALIGLVFALFGVVMSVVTDNPRFDALGSVAIGLLLVAIAVVLAWEMKGLLIGESATPEMEQQIAQSIASSEGVVRLIHMRTEHIGPDKPLVGAKIEFAPELSARLAAAIDRPRPASARSCRRPGSCTWSPTCTRAGGRGDPLTAQEGSSEDAGLKGWSPPPTLQPDLGNASGGRRCPAPASSSPVVIRCTHEPATACRRAPGSSPPTPVSTTLTLSGSTSISSWATSTR